jgi:hypothetical protein
VRVLDLARKNTDENLNPIAIFAVFPGLHSAGSKDSCAGGIGGLNPRSREKYREFKLERSEIRINPSVFAFSTARAGN